MYSHSLSPCHPQFTYMQLWEVQALAWLEVSLATWWLQAVGHPWRGRRTETGMGQPLRCGDSSHGTALPGLWRTLSEIIPANSLGSAGGKLIIIWHRACPPLHTCSISAPGQRVRITSGPERELGGQRALLLSATTRVRSLGPEWWPSCKLTSDLCLCVVTGCDWCASMRTSTHTQIDKW